MVKSQLMDILMKTMSGYLLKIQATFSTSLVTDLSLKYDVNKNIELGLFISNLLDTEYWKSGSSFGFQLVHQDRLAISFKYKF